MKKLFFKTSKGFSKPQNDIEEALKPFPEFREELFDKLYIPSLISIFLKMVQFILDILQSTKMSMRRYIPMTKI